MQETQVLDSYLHQLESVQLVRRIDDTEPAYQFKHALTQEAAYASLLLKDRREIHRHVAQVYELLYPDRLDEYAAVLAQHYAAAGDDPKWVEYAIMAGDVARRVNAHPEAQAHYAQALHTLSRLPDNEVNRRHQVDTIVKQVSISFLSHSPEENLARLTKAESVARELAANSDGRPEDRLRLTRVHFWMGRMNFYRNNRSAALEYFRQVLPMAQEVGDQELTALAYSLMGRIKEWQGEFGQAEQLFAQSLEGLERAQNWTEWVVVNTLRSMAQAARGEFWQAVGWAEKMLARSQEMHDSISMGVAYPLLGLIYFEGGDYGRALEASRMSVEWSGPSENPIPVYSAFTSLAWSESRMGQHQAARQSIARAEAVAARAGGRLFLDDWLLAIKAEMALNEGQSDRALEQVEQAVTFARSVNGIFSEGIAQRVWGEALVARALEHCREADAHMAQSVTLFESGEALLEAARTQMAWGRLSQKAGDALAAREHFERAAEQFERSRLEHELAEARRALADLAQ